MTEQEWLQCSNIQQMLDKVIRQGLPRPASEPGGSQDWLSERKLRLFAAACCRSVWHLLENPKHRYAVLIGERMADGLDVTEKQAADATSAPINHRDYDVRDLAVMCADNDPASDLAHPWETFDQIPAACNILRDLVGNPFRPVTLPTYEPDEPLDHSPDCVCGDRDCPGVFLKQSCSWLTPTVSSLALATYDNRNVDGSLDPVRLAVLTDALEEAGCPPYLAVIVQGQRASDPHPILAHLRSPAPHYRGCWAVDLLLGRD